MFVFFLRFVTVTTVASKSGHTFFFLCDYFLQFEAIEDGNGGWADQLNHKYFLIFLSPLFSHSIPTPIFIHQSVDLFHFILFYFSNSTETVTCDFQIVILSFD